MKRVAVPVVAAAGAVLVGLLAGPAPAATSGSTSTTFTLSAGALSISAPTSANLGNGFSGSSLSASLGTVTVTDQRGALVGTWAATVSSTAFTTGGATAPETVSASNVTYASGLA